MTDSIDFTGLRKDFCGPVRLFPLPNLVLFPHVVQPLHVFEPRYRELVDEALAGDRLIAMATLKPGWENDYQGRPPVASAACLGKIVGHHRLADGRFNILLAGLQRLRIVAELPPRKRFREAEVELHVERYPAETVDAGPGLVKQLRRSLSRVFPLVHEARAQLDEVLDNNVPLGTLIDLVSYLAEIGIPEKLALLAEDDVAERARRLLALLAVMAGEDRPASDHPTPFPPQCSAN